MTFDLAADAGPLGLPTTTRRSQMVVDLTCQHKNHTLLIEGPEITIRPVGTPRVMTGGSNSRISMPAARR